MGNESLDTGTLVGNAIDTIETAAGDLALPALLVGAAIAALYYAWRVATNFIMTNGDARGRDLWWS